MEADYQYSIRASNIANTKGKQTPSTKSRCLLLSRETLLRPPSAHTFQQPFQILTKYYCRYTLGLLLDPDALQAHNIVPPPNHKFIPASDHRESQPSQIREDIIPLILIDSPIGYAIVSTLNAISVMCVCVCLRVYLSISNPNYVGAQSHPSTAANSFLSRSMGCRSLVFLFRKATTILSMHAGMHRPEFDLIRFDSVCT